MSAPAISAPATRARRPADPAAPAPAPARVPIWFWVPAALLPALAWLFLLPFQSATGPPFLDWNIYRFTGYRAGMAMDATGSIAISPASSRPVETRATGPTTAAARCASRSARAPT